MVFKEYRGNTGEVSKWKKDLGKGGRGGGEESKGKKDLGKWGGGAGREGGSQRRLKFMVLKYKTLTVHTTVAIFGIEPFHRCLFDILHPICTNLKRLMVSMWWVVLPKHINTHPWSLDLFIKLFHKKWWYMFIFCQLQPVYEMIFLFKWCHGEKDDRLVIKEPNPSLFFVSQVSIQLISFLLEENRFHSSWFS